MKTDKNFRMNRETKTALALMNFSDKESKAAFKKLMIEAQIQDELARRSALKSKEPKSKDKEFDL